MVISFRQLSITCNYHHYFIENHLLGLCKCPKTNRFATVAIEALVASFTLISKKVKDSISFYMYKNQLLLNSIVMIVYTEFCNSECMEQLVSIQYSNNSNNVANSIYACITKLSIHIIGIKLIKDCNKFSLRQSPNCYATININSTAQVPLPFIKENDQMLKLNFCQRLDI